MAHAEGEKNKFPRWAVFALLIGGSMLVGLASLVALGAFVWSKKDAITEFGKEAFVSGAAYGADHNQEECAEQAFADFKHCPGFKCEFRINLFVNECMRAATPSTAYCANVPDPTNPFSLSAWSIKECNRRGYYGANQPCSRLEQGIARGCHPTIVH